MADLTRSNVTILDSWSEGGVPGKRHTTLQVQAVLTSAGTNAAGSLIPASAFGMTKILDVGDFVLDNNTVVITASPNYQGTGILLSAGGTTTATAASGTYRFVVTGIMA